MTRALLFLLLACLPIIATADDLRVNQLEQEVRELKRQVLSLSRDIDELQRARPEPALARSARTESAPTPASTDWVDAAKWRRVRVGYSELEVIAALGPPTSMREENGARVLLYAMELGSSGFLSGSVTLRDRIVAALQMPALR